MTKMGDSNSKDPVRIGPCVHLVLYPSRDIIEKNATISHCVYESGCPGMIQQICL